MSNKTPKVSAKKIKLALRLLLGVIGVGVLLGVGYYLFLRADERPVVNNAPIRTLEPVCLKTEESKCGVILEVAADDQSRMKGLSGREKLADDRGMLFVADQVEVQCFWMKEMNFSLDLVWLDEDKKVTKLERGLAPETYPTQFCSTVPDKYVVELTAGSIDRLGIELGEQMTWN